MNSGSRGVLRQPIVPPKAIVPYGRAVGTRTVPESRYSVVTYRAKILYEREFRFKTSSKIKLAQKNLL